MIPFMFKMAVPVWEAGTDTKKNYALVFKAEIPRSSCELSIACSSIYQVFVNGIFASAGPARAAHGLYKTDKINLFRFLNKEKNTIEIYVVGYNTYTFSTLNQPSFLCAEILSDAIVYAATGKYGFTAAEYKEKVCRVQRYSYQRTYLEYYKVFNDGFGIDSYNCNHSCDIVSTAEKKFIERDTPYPEFERFPYDSIIGYGNITLENEPIKRYEDRALTGIGNIADGFKRNVLDFEATDYVGRMQYALMPDHSNPEKHKIIESNCFALFKGSHNNTGFIELDVECHQNTRLILTFDEILTDGFIDYTRNATANIVVYDLVKGKHHLTTIEPYTFQYISVASIGGDSTVKNLCIIEYKFPKINTDIGNNNPQLAKIYEAAVETFRQSTLDIFMDCPSRERGGYLCDSFFTARTEYALTGKTTVEKSFLENYIAYNNNCNIPHGLLPMCYPSDFYLSEYIPNWAMWFILELEEYLTRSNDRELIDRAKEKVYMIMNYFINFENEFGLLEKLDGWIFIEWSDSNKYVMDVNFPTNMLYCRMLKSIQLLYNDDEAGKKASKLKQTILAMSYKNGFFHDRAVRNDNGQLIITDDITETAQYYAFYMNIANEKTHTSLWRTLLHDFGPFRKDGSYTDISPSNSFIGNYLRLDLLFRYGCYNQLVAEIEKAFLYMAEQTGTLWEDKSSINSSLCHGFASHAAVWLSLIK